MRFEVRSIMHLEDAAIVEHILIHLSSWIWVSSPLLRTYHQILTFQPICPFKTLFFGQLCISENTLWAGQGYLSEWSHVFQMRAVWARFLKSTTATTVVGGPKTFERTKKLNSIRSLGNQTTWGANKIQQAGRGRKLNIHIQLDKSILIKLWGGQNTKYALLMFFENVEIYALFWRTKWTQN